MTPVRFPPVAIPEQELAVVRMFSDGTNDPPDVGSVEEGSSEFSEISSCPSLQQPVEINERARGPKPNRIGKSETKEKRLNNGGILECNRLASYYN